MDWARGRLSRTGCSPSQDDDTVYDRQKTFTPTGKFRAPNSSYLRVFGPWKETSMKRVAEATLIQLHSIEFNMSMLQTGSDSLYFTNRTNSNDSCDLDFDCEMSVFKCSL